MQLDIRPRTPDRLPDLARLFGQGGDPKFCWCAFHRVRGMDFTTATAASKRQRRAPDGPQVRGAPTSQGCCLEVV